MFCYIQVDLWILYSAALYGAFLKGHPQKYVVFTPVLPTLSAFKSAFGVTSHSNPADIQ